VPDRYFNSHDPFGFAKTLAWRCFAAALLFAAALTTIATDHGVSWATVNGEGPERLANQLSGGTSIYTIVKGDNLSLISGKVGEPLEDIRKLNGLELDAVLRPGQLLAIDNRHIVANAIDDGIVINLPQRMLFLLAEGRLVRAYPVALGRVTRKWQTPAVAFTIIRLDENPVWVVPVSIQAEMAAEDETVETRVEPGPDNPLGRYRIKLSIPGYAIHSTIAPASIYKYQTHGCIRLMPENAADVFNLARVGMKGRIIYEPALLARLADGRIFAEVNRDAYHRAGDPMTELRELADSNKLAGMIDWSRIAAVANAREGIAREVTAGKRYVSGGGK
jgi:L,D-transpeptidase ErfK/SrfK